MVKNNNRTAGDDRKRDLLYMGGLGLQFRFTPLLRSQWVEPYLRVGAVSYTHLPSRAISSWNRLSFC